jgi:sporulation protein YlmC with PRC-barrel domain
MRLTDLLGVEVVDQGGRSAGRVHDVRLVQDGPLVGGFGASLRVAGLVVGGRGIGARLGYQRRKVRGPWLVKLLLKRLARDGRYVEWDRVQTVQPDRILISARVHDLSRPEAPERG